jgi:EmrB/QacA subfamily drug resistance transporter
MSISLGQPCDEGLVLSKGAAAPCRESSARWILLATILGSSMAFIDGTVVNVALAALQANLAATVLQVQWVVEAYSLLLAAFLLLGGSLGDHYGRRRVFLIGTILFALASVWCGLAPSVGQLILARGVQGFGGALLVPGSLAIIGASFDETGRGRAIGTWSGFTAIMAALGPIIGGWLIEHVSWRAVFFINLPLALIVMMISLWFVPESRDDTDKKKLDWLGAWLTAVGLGLLVYALIESSRLGFTDAAVIGTFVSGTVVLLVFWWFETRISNPMISSVLFRSRNFSGANLLTFLLYSALSGTLFFLPLNLIQVQGYSATAAGAALLPFTLLLFLLSHWGGGLAERYGAKAPLVAGPLITALGFGLFTLPGVGGDYWRTFGPAVVVLGLGMAISVAPLTATVMNAVGANRVGIASGINNAISRCAALLAIAAFGIVMLHVFDHSLDQRLATLELSPNVRQALDAERVKLAGAILSEEIAPPLRAAIRRAINDSFVEGFRYIMLIGAGLSVAGAITSLLLIEGKQGRLRTESISAQEDSRARLKFKGD